MLIFLKPSIFLLWHLAYIFFESTFNKLKVFEILIFFSASVNSWTLYVLNVVIQGLHAILDGSMSFQCQCVKRFSLLIGPDDHYAIADDFSFFLCPFPTALARILFVHSGRILLKQIILSYEWLWTQKVLSKFEYWLCQIITSAARTSSVDEVFFKTIKHRTSDIHYFQLSCRLSTWTFLHNIHKNSSSRIYENKSVVLFI